MSTISNTRLLGFSWLFFIRFSYFSNSIQIREQCQELILTDKHMVELTKRVVVEVERGLSAKTHNEADVKCFVTYVQDLPNGKGM